MSGSERLACHVSFRSRCIAHVTACAYAQELGVKKDATDRQIKKAFRKKAMQWHPDKVLCIPPAGVLLFGAEGCALFRSLG